ncbi:MAG: metalloregulator ArsR/SmtB family transcription factor [bacterium]|nr:metalloregulator ArsR/SmtB family transcription factor [bacterium]
MREVELERQLKVLANRRRLAILNLLRKRKDVNVSDVAEAIKLSLTSTSRHLIMLERMGFVEKEQKSLNVYYRISSNPPASLRNALNLL